MTRLFLFCVLLFGADAARGGDLFEPVRQFVRQHCERCHQGDEAHGEVNFATLFDGTFGDEEIEVWESIAEVLHERLMPPKDEPQPSAGDVQRILQWYDRDLLATVKPHPGTHRPRRLSAHEYRNTLHSVLGFPLEVAIIEAEQTDSETSLVMKLLPTDPPGASGFKNDTSGNPITTLLWDQYSYLVDFGLQKFFSPANRSALASMVGPIDSDPWSTGQVETLLATIGRRAFRRPMSEEELAQRVARVDVHGEGDSQTRLRRELKSMLMSPRFLYRGLSFETRVVDESGFATFDDFELAERLSYFLWADMPDDELMDLASHSKLSDPATLRRQVDRMLASPKANSLAEDLGTEWFSLGEIDHVSNNPPVRDALKSQPIDFLHELFTERHRLLELVKTDFTFINAHTAKYYPVDRKQLNDYRRNKGIEIEALRNERIQLKEQAGHRGGLLTMPGVLAMNRGPILRGTWILERVLGDDLPEPPPNVGQVQPNRSGEDLTFRQRFEQHRANAACAVCHDKIDPIGFALQSYGNQGEFLPLGPTSKKAKKSTPTELAKLDTSGRLPSGESFENFQELQAILTTTKRERVIRTIVERFLAYAVCRKLTPNDRPAVDAIVAAVREEDATFRDLIYRIVESLPFRKTAVSDESEANQ